MKKIIVLFIILSLAMTGVSMPHPFEKFLENFVPLLEKKSTQLNKSVWILETTGLDDAADLKAALDIELRLMFSDAGTYRNLLAWDKDAKLKDPILKRELNVLIRAFKQNQVPHEILEKMAEKEAVLSQSYALFRPDLDGEKVSENAILDILKKETNVEKRKKAWEASKQIGDVLAPQILELVFLRNQAARKLGYTDFFQMQLDLQEVDSKWLLKTFDDLFVASDSAYRAVIEEVEKYQSKRFQVKVEDLGPWAWSEPFSQQDPIDSQVLDQLVDHVDIVQAGTCFYEHMGLDVKSILSHSDMYERAGKSQHAFCINIDRRNDIRTLNNVKSSIKWLETVLHELGHAIYEMGYEAKLPFLLREPPHMITTEAMALLAGRQAYRLETLPLLVGSSPEKKRLMEKAVASLQRRQLIFSRWVLVMTAFESELYRNPTQDLNALWWSLVEKYQKIRTPKNRQGKSDWAAKYHMGLAPVYYYSYLLGEMFASSIALSCEKECGDASFATKKAGKFLEERLFNPGNRLSWDRLVEYVTGGPLSSDAWIKEFASAQKSSLDDI